MAGEIAEAWGRKFRPLLSTLGFTGKPGETAKVPTAGVIKSPMLVLVGLGDAVSADAQPTVDAVRRAAGAAARAVTNAASVAIHLAADTPELVDAATQGWILGSYTFTRYKGDTRNDSITCPAEVVVLSKAARQAGAVTAFQRAQLVAAATAAARDWVNIAPGDLTPAAFADAVTEAHAELTSGKNAPQVGITVVGLGSAAPPRLVELTWAPDGATRHVALVGKGVTFDSGGLSIKPANSMGTMKSDMAGAAAVVQAVFTAARLGLPVKVSAFVPMAENMISGSAVRPGDVITSYCGKTVEIMNTDAEGRLILMDALSRAVEADPDVIVDVATLTGHMVVALGERVAGVMGDQEIVEAILAAARPAGEDMWPMPIPDEMTERVRASKVADLLQHDWVRWGGGLMAAAFLREFTDEKPWAHIDIAGPSFFSGGPTGHWSTGGTGFAVATLVGYLEALASDSGNSGD